MMFNLTRKKKMETHPSLRRCVGLHRGGSLLGTVRLQGPNLGAAGIPEGQRREATIKETWERIPTRREDSGSKAKEPTK